jgi:formate dehydrogenase subunit gamma
MATRQPRDITRYRRAARWFHAAVYLATLASLYTGWWLLTGHEGRPSALASALGRSDIDVHERAGWLLVIIAGVGVTIGARAAWTFMRETLRVERGDWRWFVRWPAGALRGRFARHNGHFDPGQRILNLAFVAAFALTIGTGIALLNTPAGPMFATLDRLHRYGTYALTALVIAHILVAVGILPGYRGVWRAMHLGGRITRRTAERVWPGWLDARLEAEPEMESREPQPAETEHSRARAGVSAAGRSDRC